MTSRQDAAAPHGGTIREGGEAPHPCGPTLLFVHGWGFDASIWDPLRSALAELGGWPHAAADAGYFRQPADPVTPAMAAVHDRVLAIGHSYGVMRLLGDLPAQCAGFVAINGFTRFAAASDFPEGTPVRLLDRMLARLSTHTAAVVNDFRARCGAAATQAPAQLAPLLADLRALRDGDRRQVLEQPFPPLLVLAGSVDPIVPAAMTRAAFRDTEPLWREDAGHLLPLTDPAWCAARIRDFLETLKDHGMGRA